MTVQNKNLWNTFAGKGFAAEYSSYAERAGADINGNDIASTYATKMELSEKPEVYFIDATVNSQTAAITCTTAYAEIGQVIATNKLPVIRMVEVNSSNVETGRKWNMTYHGYDTGNGGQYKFASVDNGQPSGSNLGFITSCRCSYDEGWAGFKDKTYYDTSFVGSTFLQKSAFQTHYDECLELPAGLRYTRIAYTTESIAGDLRSVFDIALWDGLNSKPQELRFEVFINADHTAIQIKPLKLVRGYKPYGSQYFDYKGNGLGKIYVKYTDGGFSVYIGLKDAVPLESTVKVYVHCEDLLWIPALIAASVVEPTGATSIDVIGDLSDTYVHYLDTDGGQGEESSTIDELTYAVTTGKKAILAYNPNSGRYYQYNGAYTDDDAVGWYRFNGRIARDSINDKCVSVDILDIKQLDGTTNYTESVLVPACDSSGVVDISNLPAASSVTSGDTTHVPTSQAVYNYAAEKAVYKGVETGKRLYGIDSNGNAGSNVYLKIATLPAMSYQGGGGTVCIEGVVGGWNSSTQAVISLKVGTRNGVQFKFIVLNGTYDSSKVAFTLYQETDNTYSLYLKSDGYTLYDLNMHAQSGAELSYSGTSVTPSGTLVADTTSYYNSIIASNTGVGSSSQPVYVDANGQVQPCEPPLLAGTDNLDNATPTTFGYIAWYKWYYSNAPIGANFVGGEPVTAVMQSIKTHSNPGYYRQIAYTAGAGIWMRRCVDRTWTTWSKWTD